VYIHCIYTVYTLSNGVYTHSNGVYTLFNGFSPNILYYIILYYIKKERKRKSMRERGREIGYDNLRT